MTWYLVRDTGDVYDHEEDNVGSITRPYTVPDDVFNVMREQMEGDQPSAYNQTLIADAAMDQIELVASEDELPFDPS